MLGKENKTVIFNSDIIIYIASPNDIYKLELIFLVQRLNKRLININCISIHHQHIVRMLIFILKDTTFKSNQIHKQKRKYVYLCWGNFNVNKVYLHKNIGRYTVAFPYFQWFPFSRPIGGLYFPDHVIYFGQWNVNSSDLCLGGSI